MMEIVKELLKLWKIRKEEAAYRAQLMKMPLNFEALEHLVKRYPDKKITVLIDGGNQIVIEPTQPERRQSFRERFDEYHNTIN